MTSSTKTIWFTDLILCMSTGDDYIPRKNTTLNEKFNIKIEDNLLITENPTIKYFALGNGNMRILPGGEDMLYYSNHKVTDGALYNHIPFIARESKFDLNNDEKSKYRMRKLLNVNGIEYAVYYLKVIDTTKVKNQLLHITTSEISMPKIELLSTNDSSILEPIHREVDSPIENIGDEYVTTSNQITITLTTQELEEIKSAMELLSLDVISKEINEIALCTGIDSFDHSAFTNEAIKSQIAIFVDVNYDIQESINTDNGFFREIEVGGMQPLSLR